jgi:hypothetical protein
MLIVSLALLLIILCLSTPLLVVTGVAVNGEDEEKLSLIEEKLNNGDRLIIFYEISDSELDHTVERMYNDPSLFWLGSSYKKSGLGSLKMLFLDDNYSNLDGKSRYIESTVENILSNNVTSDMSDYEKVLAVHDWICDNITYESSESDQGQTIYSLLNEKKSVCAGYTKTFVYMLDKLGIRAEVQSGTAIDENGDESSHAWAVVWLDDEPCYFDITWDDIGDGIPAMHSWFGITADKFKEKHNLSDGYEWQYPDSDSFVNYDYYVVNGLVVSRASVEQIASLLAASDDGVVEFRAMDSGVLDDVLSITHDGEKLYEISVLSGVEFSEMRTYVDEKSGSVMLVTSNSSPTDI